MPIEAGGRLTGASAGTASACSNIQTDDEPAVGDAGDELLGRARSSATSCAGAASACMYTGRSVGPDGRRAQRGVRRRRHVRVLRQPDDQHLLGADADRTVCAGDDTSYRAQLDYAGDRTACSSSAWSSATTSIRKSGSSGATTCAGTSGCSGSARGRATLKRVRKFSWIGVDRLHRERRRPLETPRRRRRVRHRVPEQRPVQRRLRATLRVPARAVPHRAGVTLPVGGYDYGTARAATRSASSGGLRHPARRARHLLQRPQDDGQHHAAALNLTPQLSARA